MKLWKTKIIWLFIGFSLNIIAILGYSFYKHESSYSIVIIESPGDKYDISSVVGDIKKLPIKYDLSISVENRYKGVILEILNKYEYKNDKVIK